MLTWLLQFDFQLNFGTSLSIDFYYLIIVGIVFFRVHSWLCIVDLSFSALHCIINIFPLLLFFLHFRSKKCQQDHDCFVEGVEHGSLSILGNLLAIHQFGKESQMEKISLASNILHVDANQCVESSALVCTMELAVKSIVGKLN